jgi:fibronectin-binding autotransporter adhesin
MRHTNPTSLILLLLTLMGYSAAAMAEPEVNALPTNGQVQAGDITIEQNITADQAVMNINQATERGIIHWDTFNVGEQSTVNFNQPTTQSVTLNRITTANPSQIYGQINANGEVILENSSGIYFSPSASIEVGGITATTGTSVMKILITMSDALLKQRHGSSECRPHSCP